MGCSKGDTPTTPRPSRHPHLLEGVLKESLSGNTDLHVAGQGIGLQGTDTRPYVGWHDSPTSPAHS